MKKILIGLVLGLTMIALIAMPALAGSDVKTGMQKAAIPGGYGFVIFNVNQDTDTVSVNVAVKGYDYDTTVPVKLYRVGAGGTPIQTQYPVLSGANNAGCSFTVGPLGPGEYGFYVKVGNLATTATVWVTIFP